MSAAIDLRAEVRKGPLVVPELDALSDDDRAVAEDAWRRRMVSEHVSARVFAALVPQAIRAGLPHRRLVTVSRMVEQELSHGLLCARVLDALGGAPEALVPDDLDDVPAHDECAPLEAVLRNIIATSCLHETVAVALVTAEREQVRAGVHALDATFAGILGDEVRHARFGWLVLRDVAPRLGAREKERLGEYLVDAFDAFIRHYAPLSRAGAPSDAVLAVGVPDSPSHARLVAETLTEVILPGLEAHGIPARDAWRAAVSAS